MRPALRALAEQQIQLDAHGAAIAAIASAAGLDVTPFQKAAQTRIAALRRTADEANPANPIPEPAATAPVVTTQEAATPQATTDVTTPAAAPVATEGVTPDANTSVTDTAATVLDEPLDLNEVDVTAPVQGTQAVDGANKVEHDISSGIDSPPVDTPMFPVQGPFAEQAKVTGSQERAFASLRLARLRIQAKIAPPQEDVILAHSIASSNLTDADMAKEINTLSAVAAASAQDSTRPVARSIVPRAASATAQGSSERAVPSLVSAASGISTVGSMAVTQDEVAALW